MRAADLTYMLIPILGFLTGCSNASPTVSFLTTPTSEAPKIQSLLFVDTNVAASKTVSTADNFKAKVVIRSGGPIGTLKTSDQYRMSLRQVTAE